MKFEAGQRYQKVLVFNEGILLTSKFQIKLRNKRLNSMNYISCHLKVIQL